MPLPTAASFRLASALRMIKRYFYCQCHRCALQHDLSRGLRCPRCYKGTVYPPNPQWQSSSSRVSGDRVSDSDRASRARRGQNGGGYERALGVSACSACGLVPTARWLESAERVEMYLVSLLWSLQEEWDPQTAKVRDFGGCLRSCGGGVVFSSRVMKH